jgi:hypothetical protein
MAGLSRLVEILHGLAFVAFGEGGEAAIVQEIRIPGLHFQPCVEVGQGEVDILPLPNCSWALPRLQSASVAAGSSFTTSVKSLIASSYFFILT